MATRASAWGDPGDVETHGTGESGRPPSGLGGHEVLRKPFTLVGLEQAVARAMARERPDAPHRLAAE